MRHRHKDGTRLDEVEADIRLSRESKTQDSARTSGGRSQIPDSYGIAMNPSIKANRNAAKAPSPWGRSGRCPAMPGGNSTFFL